ncbi:MAG TPA: hypothetical protein VKA95_09885 [Nitrososphaeraceae archaeon]|nr:hypothetical protein [Nitrososphaeraceae archaeon]
MFNIAVIIYPDMLVKEYEKDHKGGLILMKNNNNMSKVIGIAITTVLITSTIGVSSFVDNVIAQTTTSSSDTFTMSGPIDSLVYVINNDNNNTSDANITTLLLNSDKFVLSGDWSLSINGGALTNFGANFTKVLANGNRWHTHELINFKTNNNTIQLSPDESLSLPGTVDVKLNNTIPWNNTKTIINISKGNTITINLNNEDTDNHFIGQPIYGIVKSIKDRDGNEMKK